MKDLTQYLHEQIKYSRITVNISKYSTKSLNMQNHFGKLWETLDPLVQVGVNYLIFEVLFHKIIPGYPALPWMCIGWGIYEFIRNVVMVGALSISRQFTMATKMKFPLSILPTASMIGFLPNLLIMVGGGFGFAISYGYKPSIYWLQVIYYLGALVIFGVTISLLFSTIMVVLPDIKYFLNYFFRVAMFTSGVVFSLSQFSIIPPLALQMQMLSPIYYLVEGFRDAAFSRVWFWEKPMFTLSFWALILFMLMIAVNGHMKIRERMSELM